MEKTIKIDRLDNGWDISVGTNNYDSYSRTYVAESIKKLLSIVEEQANKQINDRQIRQERAEAEQAFREKKLGL